MTITDIAAQLLTHFAPEQRSIPDSETYPGCNAAVMRAMNGALQEMFTGAAPWVRKDERGELLHAPATSVSIDVANGSREATISADTWQDWFAGCAIVIDGGSVTNQIRNDARQVELKFPYDGNTTSVPKLMIGGSITPIDAIQTLLPTGSLQDGRTMWTTDGIMHLDSEGFSLPFGYFTAIHLPDPEQWVIGGYDGQWSKASSAMSPVGLTGWTATAGATGSPTLSIVHTKTATVYHSSVSLPSDVMAVYAPVKVGQAEVYPLNTAPSRHRLAYGCDYGFATVTATGPGVHVGRPLFYDVETWSPDPTQAPGTRILLYPAIGENSTLSYTAKISPPVITDLASTDTLPIPLQFIESLFMPIATQLLMACPFFLENGHADEINRAYKQAKTDLANLNPRRNAGTRMRSLY